MPEIKTADGKTVNIERTATCRCGYSLYLPDGWKAGKCPVCGLVWQYSAVVEGLVAWSDCRTEMTTAPRPQVGF